MSKEELQFKVIPVLEELFFPATLLGEKISYTQDEQGFWIRSNKDKLPEDKDYIPNIIINISPTEQLKKIKNYFELSYFTPKQLEYIFNILDKKFEIYAKTPLTSFVSYDSMQIKFELLEKDLKMKINQILENYSQFKEELFIENIPADNTEFTPQFKTSYNVEELAYFFRLMIEQGIINLEKNQKTKFFDFLVSNFQSKDKSKISLNSFRNKSYDPSTAAIDNIHSDLIQMAQLAFNHKKLDKIEWKK
ncbi:MAG: hypothetical protein PHS04_02445 [Tissierellia bacterium]|nr:hypothetical protein [Tissierellia bacterium]